MRKFWPQENFELILVNNGSTDESAEILAAETSRPENGFVRVVTVERNIGYGHGILTGLKAARAPVLAYSHADIQTPPEDVFKAFHLLAERRLDVDQTLIKGKRMNRPKDALVLTNGLAKIVEIVLGQQMDDINGQPKLFSHHLLAQLRRPPTGFAFDTYLMYVARLQGMALVDFPVDFGVRLHGQSKWATSILSRYKTIWRYLVSVGQIAMAHYDAPGNLLRQFTRFIATGILTNVVNYATFWALLRLLGVHYVISSVTGFLAGFVVGFWVNRQWTFEAAAGKRGRQLARFFIVNAISLAANVATIRFFTEVVRLIPEISQLIAIAVSTLINFTGSKFWAFRRAS
ncbi:MAG: bifunctional glycosyltransferase family 2/GtrA family protein [Chloroflexi bacterium]|nr:bifunctional glycosyltransferase family 2/GtrA family protein [Chloroflexota bacterium]MCI0646452.1 bifunctional glycosyltransferase family 2/GtrA family protein [Chloroflexota bacterium]